MIYIKKQLLTKQKNLYRFILLKLQTNESKYLRIASLSPNFTGIYKKKVYLYSIRLVLRAIHVTEPKKYGFSDVWQFPTQFLQFFVVSDCFIYLFCVIEQQ